MTLYSIHHIYAHMSYTNFPSRHSPWHRTVPAGALHFCTRVSWMAPLASEMARHGAQTLHTKSGKIRNWSKLCKDSKKLKMLGKMLDNMLGKML